MKTLITALALSALLFACTDEDGTRSTLQKSGFTDIRVGGYAPFSCSKGDDTCTEFTAKNSQGQVVTGVVGCGYVFKSCTVRF